MQYFSTNFQKSPSARSSPPQRSFTFDFRNLKLRYLARIVFFKLVMTKWKFKKAVITSFQWHHRYYVTEKRHQTNVTRFFYFGPLPIKISGYASAINQ